MTKKIIKVTVIVMSIMLIIGCDKKSPSESEEEPIPTTDEGKIEKILSDYTDAFYSRSVNALLSILADDDVAFTGIEDEQGQVSSYCETGLVVGNRYASYPNRYQIQMNDYVIYVYDSVAYSTASFTNHENGNRLVNYGENVFTYIKEGTEWKISSVNYINQEPRQEITDSKQVAENVLTLIEDYQQKLTEKNKIQLLPFFRKPNCSTFFGFNDNYFPSISRELRQAQYVIDACVAHTGAIQRVYTNIQIVFHTHFLAIAFLDYSALVDGQETTTGQEIWSLISANQRDWKITSVHWQ